MGEAQDISPSLGAGGVPLCSEGNCPAYDGKRCKALGFSPDRICEPAVVRLARRDDDIRGEERRKLTEAVNAIRDEARRIEDERDEARAQLAAAQAENGRLRTALEDVVRFAADPFYSDAEYRAKASFVSVRALADAGKGEG